MGLPQTLKSETKDSQNKRNQRYFMLWRNASRSRTKRLPCKTNVTRK